ncbi:MAG: tRNA dihydrouridine synthase DusB [bacterium]
MSLALTIDDLDLGTLFLSPMAGVTDTVYRRLCRRMGADALYTEFVSSEGIVRNNRRTLEMITFHEEERPLGIQIFGGDPEVVARAAREAWEEDPDLIDINFGCPAKKVTKNMAGCAILRDMGLYRDVVAAVVESVPGIVTVKIRAGWDEENLVYIEAARIAAEEGARAVALHPRTRVQGYSGRADWDRITRLVEESPIPVIGNGDLFEPRDIRAMLEETGCAAVMVARGAIGNPWIFQRTREYLRTGTVPSPPDVEERLGVALEHARLSMEHKGEVRGLREMRKHVADYTKGLWCGARLREAIYGIEEYGAMEELIEEYLEAAALRDAGEGGTFRPRTGGGTMAGASEKEAVGA